MIWNVFTDYYLTLVFCLHFSFTDIRSIDRRGALDGTSITDCCFSFSSHNFPTTSHVKTILETLRFVTRITFINYEIRLGGKFHGIRFNEWPRKLQPRTYWTDPSSGLTYGGYGHVTYRSRDETRVNFAARMGWKWWAIFTRIIQSSNRSRTRGGSTVANSTDMDNETHTLYNIILGMFVMAVGYVHRIVYYYVYRWPLNVFRLMYPSPIDSYI